MILDQQNVGRLSRMDAIQQNLSLASDTNRYKKIPQIEYTLKRIEISTFSICISCNEEISEKGY